MLSFNDLGRVTGTLKIFFLKANTRLPAELWIQFNAVLITGLPLAFLCLPLEQINGTALHKACEIVLHKKVSVCFCAGFVDLFLGAYVVSLKRYSVLKFTLYIFSSNFLHLLYTVATWYTWGLDVRVVWL